MSKLVSIIIPVYNRSNLIVETLKTISQQTYDFWECILVDDHSTDNTVKVIKDYIENDKRFIITQRPNSYKKGANSCRNYGFEISKGNFINWFDSDDLMHKDFIKEKVLAIKDNDCVISKTSFFKDDLNNIFGKEHRTKLTSTLLEDFITLKVSWYLPDPMWKKSFLNHKDLFSVDLKKGQDRDFHIRMLMHKPKIDVIDKYLTYYRQHEVTISNNDSKEVMQTYFNALDSRIKLLLKKPITNNLKSFLLKSQIKNYPYVYKQKGILSYYFKLFKSLFSVNLKNIKVLFKFLIAIVLFKTVGKGSFVLKG